MYYTDIFCKSSIYILKSENTFFFYYSEYKIRTLYLIFKYIFLESNPL